MRSAARADFVVETSIVLHAAEWQCFRELDAPGEFERLPWDAPEREPTYREVERLLGPADMGAQLRDSFSFIRDTLSPPS